MDKYIELDNLGSGAYSRVDLYRNKVTDQLVAIKELPRNAHTILTEISIMKELLNPHIPCYYEVITTDYYVYIVMEHIPGYELHNTVRYWRKAEVKDGIIYNHLLDILKDLIKTLSYIHSKNIIHCDIKPENILIKNNCNTAVLIDFGLSQLIQIDDKVSNSGIIGTGPFIAPEVSLRGTIKPVSDIWSLGISFYDAIYGKVWPNSATEHGCKYYYEYTSNPANTPVFKTSSILLNRICQAMSVTDWKLRPTANKLLEMFI